MTLTSVGVTVAEPGELAPVATPWSISTVEMLVPPQEIVALPPRRMAFGVVFNSQTGLVPPPPVVMVTGAVHVTVPPAPVAVPVNVSEAVIGAVVIDPPD